LLFVANHTQLSSRPTAHALSTMRATATASASRALASARLTGDVAKYDKSTRTEKAGDRYVRPVRAPDRREYRKITVPRARGAVLTQNNADYTLRFKDGATWTFREEIAGTATKGTLHNATSPAPIPGL
jgi:hypothetical protein